MFGVEFLFRYYIKYVSLAFGRIMSFRNNFRGGLSVILREPDPIRYEELNDSIPILQLKWFRSDIAPMSKRIKTKWLHLIGYKRKNYLAN